MIIYVQLGRAPVMNVRTPVEVRRQLKSQAWPLKVDHAVPDSPVARARALKHNTSTAKGERVATLDRSLGHKLIQSGFCSSRRLDGSMP